jgi:DNA-binding CsgD family transcriptional regulator
VRQRATSTGRAQGEQSPARRLVGVDEALGSGDPLLALEAHTLGAVVALVPAGAAAFVAVSRRRELRGGVALLEPGMEIDLPALWAWFGGDDPFAPPRLAQPDATVLALEHVEGGAPGYAGALRAAGWGDRAVVYLRDAGTIVALVSLMRAADAPRFTRADAAMLRRIQPLLEHVYASALEPGGPAVHDALRRAGLTAREADVVELVGRGASNAEIARSLHVSEATVKTHLTRIYTKVGVRTRTQLAILAGSVSGRS